MVENAFVSFSASSERWLLRTNAAALVLPDGLRVYDHSTFSGMGEPPSYLVTNLQGGLVVGGFAVVLIGVGVWLFARRDLH